MVPNNPAQTTQPTQPEQVPQTPTTSRSNHKLIIGIVLGALILTVIAIGYFFVARTNAATVSGYINFTALKPDPQDQGQIALKYRKYGTTEEYKKIDSLPQLQDTAPWTWTEAENGQPYEVIAELSVNDKLITTSEPLIVTAPAINQELALRVTWHDLPVEVVQEQTTAIKGHTIINGLIPASSRLFIQAKAMDGTTFETVATINTPTNDNPWEWKDVTPLKDYSLKGILVSGTTVIGTSDIMTAAGGDNEIELMINSMAQPDPTPTQIIQPTAKPTATPTPIIVTATPVMTITSVPTATPIPTEIPTPTPVPAKGKISGKILINGPKDANTSVVLLSRKPGQGDFQTLTKIDYPKQDGQNWEWDDATVGTNYEIMAELQVNNNTTATARSQVVAGPAKNVDFILNTGVTVPTTNETPSLAACTNNHDNQWDATIQFPNVNNAGNYWFKVGTNPSSADTFNSKQRPQTNTDKQNVTIRVDSKNPYFAQYAFSICINCSSDKNFSNFSHTVQFTCGEDGPPAPTQTPFPTAIPTTTPVPTKKPTSTPIPILTVPVELKPSPR